ncbi:MAG: hypothetical protein IPH93_13015 [Saprospiraceae bacterium]|nr:hypothetical protein [Saprospiraceae bacterium]
MFYNAKLLSLRYYLQGLLICFNIFLVQAQSDSIGYSAYQTILDVSKGQLLVRLKSHRNKLEALTKELNKVEPSSSTYERISKEIQIVTSQRDSFNYNLILAMKRHFTLSPVYFYYDRDHLELKKNNFKSPLYLDSSLQAVSLPEFRNQTIVIMVQGQTVGQELDAFIFIDAQGNSIPPPFPSYIRINSFRPVMNELAKTYYYDDNAVWYAKKIDKKLRKMYEKALKWKAKNYKWE